jgi:hypothetical protein
VQLIVVYVQCLPPTLHVTYTIIVYQHLDYSEIFRARFSCKLVGSHCAVYIILRIYITAGPVHLLGSDRQHSRHLLHHVYPSLQQVQVNLLLY